MASLLAKFKHLLLDLPMRQKLLVAFMATISLPLLIVAAFSLSYYLDYTTRSATSRLRDKLDIGSLVLDNAAIGLLNLNKRIAGDHTVVMSLDLSLTSPVSDYLQTIQARQDLDFALILGTAGEVLASGGSLGQPEAELAASFEGSSFWNAAGNALVSYMPIFNTEHAFLGYSCIGYRFGAMGGSGGASLMRRLESQLGVPFFLASAAGMVHVSPALGGLVLDAGEMIAQLSPADSRIDQTIHASAGSYRSQGIALRDGAGLPVSVLGVAIPVSELQAAQNLTLAVILLVFMLAFLLSFLVARWFADFIARPIAAVAQGTRAIIKGNFEFRFEPQGHDEIGLMTEDFAIMTLQLRKLVDELAREAQEHKDAEFQIRLLNADLEQRVSDRTLALTQSNAALTDSLEMLKNAQKELIESEKMAALSHLVVGVAHELNTPIGNSLTTITFLESQTETMDQRQSAGALSRAEFNEFIARFRQAAVLTRQNLLRAGKLVGFFKQMAVNLDEELAIVLKPCELVDQLIHSLPLGPEGAKVRMVNSVAPDLILRSRPGALVRVLTSLAENALDHAFEGQETGVLHFESRLDGEWVELLVRDEGTGIPPAEISKVFDPFYTTRRGQGHVGLGLSIAFNLVTGRLGGSIQCQSQAGKGTTFRVRLPAIGNTQAV